jgi:hypothetical protein
MLRNALQIGPLGCNHIKFKGLYDWRPGLKTIGARHAKLMGPIEAGQTHEERPDTS